jgi:hypothetical protein
VPDPATATNRAVVVATNKVMRTRESLDKPGPTNSDERSSQKAVRHARHPNRHRPSAAAAPPRPHRGGERGAEAPPRRCGH